MKCEHILYKDAVALVRSLPNYDDMVRRYVADALLTENERLRMALKKVGDDYPGSSCQRWCYLEAGFSDPEEMKNIVKRLRDLTELTPGVTAIADENLFSEAADEIERLRDEIDRIRRVAGEMWGTTGAGETLKLIWLDGSPD